jgi:hypothetical protein
VDRAYARPCAEPATRRAPGRPRARAAHARGPAGPRGLKARGAVSCTSSFVVSPSKPSPPDPSYSLHRSSSSLPDRCPSSKPGRSRAFAVAAGARGGASPPAPGEACSGPAAAPIRPGQVSRGPRGCFPARAGRDPPPAVSSTPVRTTLL